MIDSRSIAAEEYESLRQVIPHVWADFAQMKTYADDPFILDSADGIHVFDALGNRYIDTLAGTACVSVGHRNPVVIDAMIRQLDRMTFASPNSSVNSASLRLAGQLLPHLPPGFTTVKFFSGGSEANEGMIKVARQYFHQTGRPAKHKIIGRYGEAIGGTLACKAVGGAMGKFGPQPSGFIQVQPCNIAGGSTFHRHKNDVCDLSCVQAIEDVIKAEGPETVAAVAGAPIGQTIWPHPDYWPAVREICDRYDVLLLFDEIVTGFGRLGTMWGSEYVGAYPDLMATGKGMSGGYAPLSALFVHGRVAEAFWGDEDLKFDEGHTFNANPLSAAVGRAVLGYLLEHDLIGNARRVGAHLLERARSIAAKHDEIGAVHGAGLWVVLLSSEHLPARFASRRDAPFGRLLHQVGRRHGLLIRPYANRVLLAPPLTITRDEVDEMMDELELAIEETLAA